MSILKNSVPKLFISLMLTCLTPTIRADVQMCSNPGARICNETTSMRYYMQDEIQKLKEEIAVEAIARAQVRIKEMKSTISLLKFKEKKLREDVIVFKEIMNVAKTKFGVIGSITQSREEIEKIRGYFLQAIDESNFTGTIKELYKSKIKSVVIGNFTDIVERLKMNDLNDSTPGSLQFSSCGPYGLATEAFATEINNIPYVIICPGFAIGAYKEINQEQRFNTILHALAHELGHHVDTYYFPKNYSDFLDCSERDLVGLLKISATDLDYCTEINSNSKESCKRRILNSHAREMIADIWGIKVTNIHARQMQYNPYQTEIMLTNSWMKLCGSRDEGIHPGPGFRMNLLLGLNEDLRKNLECSQKIRPVCGF